MPSVVDCILIQLISHASRGNPWAPYFAKTVAYPLNPLYQGDFEKQTKNKRPKQISGGAKKKSLSRQEAPNSVGGDKK